MIELTLLWSAFGCMVLLAVWRRDQTGLPWLGMILAVAGILTLVMHASRQQIAGVLGAHVAAPGAAEAMPWRLIELFGLVLVGTGVVVMSLIADRERRMRRLSSQLEFIAPQLHGSGEVLRSVLASAPGAWVLLKPAGPDASDFEVIHMDERARASLRSPRDGSATLSLHRPRHIAGVMAEAASESWGGPGIVRRECTDEGRWYEIAAGTHADAVIILLDDITQRKDAEFRLHRAAYADPVTGLANRTLLEQQIEECFAQSKANERETFGVLWLDFDGFKAINDRHGHLAGDELLRGIGARITQVLEQTFRHDSGSYLAARWGGDEFVVIVRRVTLSQAAELGEKIRAALAVPHRINGVEIRSTASVGVVVRDEQHACAEDVLHDADTAMYEAKRAGKNTVWARRSSPPEPMRFESADDPGGGPGGRVRAA